MANEITPELRKQNDLMLKNMELEFNRALPKHITKERFLRIVQTEFSKNPKLLLCEKVSLLGSIMFAAQLGLEIGAHLGHCFLIPYYSKKDQKYYCTVQYGYKGLLELVRRSDKITSISSQVIHENDFFEIDPLNNTFSFKPLLKGDRGKWYLAAAVAKFKDGSQQVTFMTKAQVMKRKAVAQSQNIWDAWEEEMAQKTVSKSLCKWLPISIEDQRLITMDDRIIKTASDSKDAIIDNSEAIEFDIPTIEEAPKEFEEAPKVEQKAEDEPRQAKNANDKGVEVEQSKPRANPLLKKQDDKKEEELFGA